jgi:uncharacterized protein YerC
MTQLSKRPISKNLENRMYEILWSSITKLNRKENASDFLDDILTTTERLMIAKRLGTALLLSRGWDHDAISRYLKVSTSTIAILKGKLISSGKGYREAIAQIEKDQKWEQMKLDLSQALEEILASRVSANWKQSKLAVAKKYQEKRSKYKIL